jgi:hypothetical protein
MKLIAARSPTRELRPGFSRSLFARRPTAGRGNGGGRCSPNSHISAILAARTAPGLLRGPLTIIIRSALSSLRGGRGGVFSPAIGTGRRAQRSNASGVSKAWTAQSPLRQSRKYVGRAGRGCERCLRHEAAAWICDIRHHHPGRQSDVLDAWRLCGARTFDHPRARRCRSASRQMLLRTPSTEHCRWLPLRRV